MASFGCSYLRCSSVYDLTGVRKVIIWVHGDWVGSNPSEAAIYAHVT